MPTRVSLSPEVEFHADICLLVYRPRGVINESSINKVISILSDLEGEQSEPFNRFLDTLAADEIDLNYQHIIQVSLFRRLSYAGKPPVKSAILATDSAMTHYAQLHSLMTRDSPINAEVFHERETAAKWLGVPVERLVTPVDQKRS